MIKTTYLRRDVEPMILEDLARKMVFTGGPRQCGKTTLARHCATRVRGATGFLRNLNDSLNPPK